MTERLNIVMTNIEPLNKHVIWLKDDMLKRWSGVGWKNIGGTGGNGTTNYNDLINKPKINGVELQGDIDLELGTNVEIINSLTSSDTDKALSANQGKILDTKLSLKANIATTINGYGIEDAYTKVEVNNAINNAIKELNLPDVDLSILKTDGDGTKFLNDKGEYTSIIDATGIIITQEEFDALETYNNAVYFIRG